MKTFLFASMLTAASFANGAIYDIDPSHSSATFSVRHLMVSNVRGEFSKLSGNVEYDPKNLAATKVNATVDATTIATRDAKRDAHLRSAEFFDVEKFPTLMFVSKQVSQDGSGKLKLVGDLTIHGVTKSVTFDVDGPTQEVKDPWGNTRLGAAATTKVNRRDFGLNWNAAIETGGVVVGDEVNIQLDLELVKKK